MDFPYTEVDRHLVTFEGLDVVDYDPEQGLSDPATTAPRLYQLYYDATAEPRPLTGTRKAAMVAVVGLTIVGVVLWSGWAVLFGLFALIALQPGYEPPTTVDIEQMWGSFAAEPRLAEVQALVIGPWFAEIDEDPDVAVEFLRELAPKMPRLRALFFGDIVSEECEISWITQGDLTPLLDAYPNLETLCVRGGNGLRFTELVHPQLRKLVVQSGALFGPTIADVAAARLPSLEHLELWFGAPEYGFEATIDELRPLWEPDRFGALTSLALRNCSLADEIAQAFAREQNAVSRLERLDLSLGTLTDLGAEALFNNPAIAHLDVLDLHHHYMSDDWMAKLSSLPLEVDVSDPQGAIDAEDDRDAFRYVAVSE